MSNVKQVEVGGVKCNIGQATAEEQYDLFLLVGPIVDRTYKEVDDVPTISTKELRSVFLYSGSLMKQAAKLALSKTIIDGTQTPVSVADFQGNVDAYHELICEAMRANLIDFFTRLGAERTERLRLMQVETQAV